MGSVFGKQTVLEPAFDILLDRVRATTTYEIREYGERFAAEVSYSDGEGSPFMVLAKYIGVFGSPENEGSESISMTAPVVIQGGTKIAMTAPVVTEGDDNDKVMKFMLPVEYDDLSKIPKPNNPQVHISQIPAQVGAVHRFHGSFEDIHNREMALKLAKQLMDDGVEGITEDYVLQCFQSFGYNAPFTIPYFRRNEVWVELSVDQVDQLLNKFKPSASN
jgi:hypothetical protein